MNKLKSIFTAALCIFSFNSNASVMYTYAGKNFNSFTGSLFDSSMSVTGYIEFNDPLAPNLVNQNVTPLSYSFTDGISTLTNNAVVSGTRQLHSFEFYTDANGKIIMWDVNISLSLIAPSELGDTSHEIKTRFKVTPFTDETIDFGSLGVCSILQSGNNCSVFNVSRGEISNNHGAWSQVLSVPTSPLIKDSFLTRSDKDLNEGINKVVVVGGRRYQRTVLAFDLVGITPSEVVNATLVLNLKQPTIGWGTNGRPVNVHLLSEPFVEGNGFDWGYPWDSKIRGCGSGVTWNCATDTEIGNRKRDCDDRWRGGSDFIDPATDSTIINNGQTGDVSWDVTIDVQAAVANEDTEIQWLLKKANEHRWGSAVFYSKEGAAAMGDMSKVPKLELEFSD